MAHSNETQGDLMRPFSYGTNVQIERTRKDSPRVYICCRTEFKTLLFHYEQIISENSGIK